MKATVDLGPFEEGAAIDQLLELIHGDERIVDAVHFAWTRRSGGGGNTEVQAGNAFTQAANDGGLPDCRRSGQHDYASSLDRWLITYAVHGCPALRRR
jgi:hypothetical protein